MKECCESSPRDASIVVLTTWVKSIILRITTNRTKAVATL